MVRISCHIGWYTISLSTVLLPLSSKDDILTLSQIFLKQRRHFSPSFSQPSSLLIAARLPSNRQRTAQLCGQFPPLYGTQRPVFEVPDALELRTGAVEPGHRAAGQRYAEKRLLLAYRVREDKSLEPAQRVHLQDRLDAGVCEIGGPRHLTHSEGGIILGFFGRELDEI
jgi:hypothetical protein